MEDNCSRGSIKILGTITFFGSIHCRHCRRCRRRGRLCRHNIIIIAEWIDSRLLDSPINLVFTFQIHFQLLLLLCITSTGHTRDGGVALHSHTELIILFTSHIPSIHQHLGQSIRDTNELCVFLGAPLIYSHTQPVKLCTFATHKHKTPKRTTVGTEECETKTGKKWSFICQKPTDRASRVVAVGWTEGYIMAVGWRLPRHRSPFVLSTIRRTRSEMLVSARERKSVVLPLSLERINAARKCHALRYT